MATENKTCLSDDEVIRRALREGINTMRHFGWVFPPPSAIDTGRDVAAKGFKKFYAGVTRMSTVAERLSIDEAFDYAQNILTEVECYWPEILRFLLTTAVQKKTFIKQLQYVASKLSKNSPSFYRAVVDSQRQSDNPEDTLLFFLTCDTMSCGSAQSYDTCMTNLTCMVDIDEDIGKKTSEDSLTDAAMETTNGVGARRILTTNPALFWRSNLYGSKKSGRKRLGRISDGTKVKVVQDDPDSEYIKVEITGWVKKSDLLAPESYKKQKSQKILSNRDCLK
jgi:hypothetical protein